MKGALLIPLVLAVAGAAAEAPPDSPAGAPSLAVERWLHNSGERAAAGRKAYSAGDAPAAAAALDQSLRLRPELPEARFNAGTGRLRAGSDGAAELLESAAREAPPGLAPRAWYNLGNARLAGGDSSAAVAAYRESLLRDPALADAKFNLELALRKLEQQKQQQGSGAQQQQQQKKEGDQGSDAQSSKSSEDGKSGQDEKEKTRQQDGRERPEPFRDQPDMSADQASALLSAVENLEREQRRREAQQRAAARPEVEIDW